MKAALAALLLVGRTALAGGGPATDAYDDLRGGAPVEVHGLVDLYLEHNFNRPSSGENQLRSFDFHADRPSIGLARVTVAHKPRRLGFRVDLGLGDVSEDFYRSDPARLTHPDEARWASYVLQAFVTVVIPVGHGLSVDVGKFGTPMGFEDNESVANWNYTRSLLFSWAEPSYHTGMRASYVVSSVVSVGAFVVNGWNSNLRDGNELRSGAVAAAITPTEHLRLVVVYLGGLERPPTQLAGPLTFRNLVAASLTWTPSQPLGFALAVDYGNDRGRTWWGVAGYARVWPTRFLSGTVRGEVLADPEGFVTGTSQQVAEGTASLDLHLGLRRLAAMIRLEYRHDQSTAPVFHQIVTRTTSQDTVAVALTATY